MTTAASKLAILVLLTVTLYGVAVLGVFVLQFCLTGLSTRRDPIRISDGRGGPMQKLAGAVVMVLGRLTIAVLHFFEKIGVDMSAFDEALARLTAFTTAQAASLKGAQKTIQDQKAEIDKLIADDAAQDQIDIADAVKKALDDAAAQLDAVTTNLENPPADTVPSPDPTTTPDPSNPPVDPSLPVVTDPGPPQTPPSSDVPVTDTPVVVDPGPLDPSLPVTPVDETGNPVDPDAPATPPVVENPVPVDPGTDPVPAGDLPADTPVVEAPSGAITEVPAETPVVSAGDLPADAPVVPVTEDPSAGTGQ